MKLDADAPLPFDEAFARVIAGVEALPAEVVELRAAYGRVVAEPVRATHPVPPFDNSMVDGFAVRVSDVASASEAAPAILRVREEVSAGDVASGPPGPGEALRIMTGAPVPAGTEAIVMLEWTEWSGREVRVHRAPGEGQFIRRAGEDLEPGDEVLPRGEALSPAAVGVCASLGAVEIEVVRRPRVAILATGDELLEPHEPLAPGKIRSSNNWTLRGQCEEAGADAVDLGLGRDDPGDLAARIERARDCDVLLTSGGVSVGDRDLVQPVLTELGFEKGFWRVAASPGKPLLFGRLGGVRVFGLPGNPVSSAVAFENFVRPVLRRLGGHGRPDRPRATAVLAAMLRGPADRRHFARVRVERHHGDLVAREVGPRGSGNLRSMVYANALAILPEGEAERPAGAEVEVILFGEPVTGPRSEAGDEREQE